MYDDLYSKLIAKVDYRLLAVLPWIVTALATIVLIQNGLSYGLEFQGGTWIEAFTAEPLSQGD